MVDITERDRDAFHEHSSTRSVKEKSSINRDTTLNIAKVFLYMFSGILLTALVAFGVGALVYYNVLVLENETALRIYLGITIASAFALLINMLVINFVTLRGRHSILVPGIIYCVLVGVLFSMLTIVIDWEIIGMAFGITALAFLLMSLIAFVSKGNLSPLLIVAMGLGIGSLMLVGFNFIFTLVLSRTIETLYWIVEFAIFAMIMFVSVFDLWRIKQIAANGYMNNNMALYCAFVIYTDFINIFIRVLYFLLLIFSRSRK